MEITLKNLVNVKYQPLKNLALITIDRAEKHNAISLQTLEELNQAVHFAATDSAIGVIAITGAGGKAFASGSDSPREARLCLYQHPRSCHTHRRWSICQLFPCCVDR